jgi:hypothetical protein
MKRFFDLTFRPFFLFTGLGTAFIGLYAFLPERAVTKLAKLQFLQDYTIIVQHWGIMVGLMGVCMMVAAVRPGWRNPILIYSALEKAFMAYLVLTNARHSYADGFWIAAAGDSTIVLYTIAYFAVCGFKPPCEGTLSGGFERKPA